MNKLEFETMKWDLYNYLKSNCVGKGNLITGSRLVEKFYIWDKVELRKFIRTLREDDAITRIICSNSKGYWLAETEEEAMETYKMLYSRGISSLMKAHNIKSKLSNNNQQKLRLFGNYEYIEFRALSDDLLKDGNK